MEQQSDERKPSRLPLLLIRWIGLAVRAVLGPPARAVRGTARRVGDPARQVVDYWAAERTTMKQGVVASVISALTSLLAGLALAGMGERLAAVQGLLVLVPVSIGMRGNIFGALGARLGTAIHTGLFEVSSNKEGILYQNIYSAAVLTLATSVTMGILARSVAVLLGIETVTVWDLVTTALVGGLMSSLVVLAVTVWLSVLALGRGWDLDTVGAPLITAIGDVVTMPCLWIASYLVGIRVVTPSIGVIGTIVAIVAIVAGWRSGRALARRIVRESFPVLCVAIVLDILAGTVVQPRVEAVFIPFPAFLILLPGFLENTGALGSILAARLGSKLHLGAMTPTARPDAAALLDGTIVLALGLTVYVITALTTLPVAAVFDQAYPGAARFTGIVLLGGILATLAAGVIGYYAAIVSHRFGFDPDNHTIPLVTSGMDLLGVICLVAAIAAFGVA
jgi:mgtE-like transporter